MLLLLLLLSSILTELIEILSKFNSVLKTFNELCTLNKNRFFCRKRNLDKRTNLVVKVQTVSKIQSADVLTFDGKEILTMQFRITFEESLRDTTITTLHQFLNTNVLNDIDKLHRNATLKRPIVRCIEGMTNFMSDHGIHNLNVSLPNRQRQNTSLYIELSSVNATMLYGEILLCK